jgi:hypothetical protein
MQVKGDVLNVKLESCSKGEPFSTKSTVQIHFSKSELIFFLYEMIRRSQVGIIIHGTTIEATVMGGPAYNSKQIDPGDVILRVDGENATADNIKELLVGEDLPGSSVTVALAKGGPQVSHGHTDQSGLLSTLDSTLGAKPERSTDPQPTRLPRAGSNRQG